jgi:transposase
VHDHWKSYYTMTGVLHAMCNAHHLRELKALVEIEKEDWARQMQRLLLRACHATNLARQRGVPLKPGLVACIERRYDAIVAEGLAFHEKQPPLARTVANAAAKREAGRRDEPGTICCCDSSSGAPTRCTFCAIPPCPSPTTRLSETCA